MFRLHKSFVPAKLLQYQNLSLLKKLQMKKTAIIIGAGPAGLTAAYELLTRTDIVPVILEKSGDIGGISKTVNYKGNRIDIGGHRFFSKSDRVMEWWLQFMPIQQEGNGQVQVSYQNKTRLVQLNNNGADKKGDKVMLVRQRLSRIYFLRKFFAYPIKLSVDTLRKLGLVTTLQIMYSYLYSRLRPRKQEQSLEDFFINRFGKKLYLLFFKDYTEKVWGVPCKDISAEWGAQRIKGVSISAAIAHAVKSTFRTRKGKGDIHQKDVETSLIEQFLYPKLGPGQLWEEVARQIQEMGGSILMHENVTGIEGHKGRIESVTTRNAYSNTTAIWEGDYFFSTMPVQELIAGLDDVVPSAIQQIAAGLQYRDFITVGVLLKKLSGKLEDTWIYIQEKDVKVGRVQLFNNWSPYMVSDPDTVWIGMEYFCNVTDDFWKLKDEAIKELGIKELQQMGLADAADVLDATVLRMEKTYPAYFGTYERFDELRRFIDQYTNLFLVGRNGMHKYNNADHSMLTAIVAVDNIAAGITSKDNLWSINTEQEYHEEKKAEEPKVTVINRAPVVSGDLAETEK